MWFQQCYWNIIEYFYPVYSGILFEWFRNNQQLNCLFFYKLHNTLFICLIFVLIFFYMFLHFFIFFFNYFFVMFWKNYVKKFDMYAIHLIVVFENRCIFLWSSIQGKEGTENYWLIIENRGNSWVISRCTLIHKKIISFCPYLICL